MAFRRTAASTSFILAALLTARCTCEPYTLTPIVDSGDPSRDAGATDAGVTSDSGIDIDAGHDDAGEADAGAFDAGDGGTLTVLDAGPAPPVCIANRPTFDFSCEGDE